MKNQDADHKKRSSYVWLFQVGNLFDDHILDFLGSEHCVGTSVLLSRALCHTLAARWAQLVQ